MTIIGFTGTRNGMTPEQKAVVKLILASHVTAPISVAHGDCVGADADFHDIATALRIPVYIYPPIDETLRAFCKSKEIFPPKTHLARNRDIVNVSKKIIATPRDMERESRGGTWYTIDYAVKNKKTAVVVWPNGTLELLGDK